MRPIVAAALTLVLALASSPASPVSAQEAPFCQPRQSPQFAFGFAELKAELGAIMGEPVDCAHPNDEYGNVLQRTTTGLAFWRKATNTPTFTDGRRNWGLTASGLVD